MRDLRLTPLVFQLLALRMSREEGFELLELVCDIHDSAVEMAEEDRAQAERAERRKRGDLDG